MNPTQGFLSTEILILNVDVNETNVIVYNKVAILAGNFEAQTKPYKKMTSLNIKQQKVFTSDAHN